MLLYRQLINNTKLMRKDQKDMTKNYFAVERAGKCICPVVIKDEDGEVHFEDLMNMNYEEMKSYKNLDIFITAVMDATNECFEENDDQTIVTLIGEDDVFIWGVLIGPGENTDEMVYKTINWKEDGKSYRYAKD